MTAPPITHPSHGGTAATVPMIEPMAQSCRRENEQRRHPQNGRDNAADRGAVAILEIVADRSQLVRGGDTPYGRTDPEGQHNRSDGG